MVISGIKENGPQQWVQSSQIVQDSQGKKGLGQVPDRLEAPQDAGCLDGIFSSLSECLIALYEGLMYLVQLPFQWLFGKAEEEVPNLPPNPPPNPSPRPRAESDVDLEKEENPIWGKEDLLASVEAGRIEALLEVAEKAGDKELKVEEGEAFEVIQKLDEKDPDAFKAIMTIYCAKKETDVPEDCKALLAHGFDFKVFYVAVLEYQLRDAIESLRAATNSFDRLDRFYAAIPEGADQKMPREKRVALQTIRILMGEIPKALQDSIAFYMSQIDQSERYGGDLGFTAVYGDGINFDMMRYLTQEKIPLGLVREAIPQTFFGLIFADFANPDKPIGEKLNLLRRAIGRVDEQDQIRTLLEQFSEQNQATYQKFLNGHSLEKWLEDGKQRILEAIRSMIINVRTAEQREALLASLADEKQTFAAQFARLQPLVDADDREALQKFVSVEGQRQQFAECIIRFYTDAEFEQFVVLAKPSNSGVFSGLFSSGKAQKEKAVKDYLNKEETYRTLDMQLVKIGFRKESK